MTFPIVQNRTAIITGAAVGMGRETALLFGEAGAKVVVADLEELGTEVASEITEAGGTAIFHRTDISQADQLEELMEATVSVFGRLDIAVNNAALKPDSRPLEDFDEDYWDRLHSVDLKGTALSMKCEIRQLLSQGDGGRIVNISSINGFKPSANSSGYIAAKHGVVGLTKAVVSPDRRVPASPTPLVSAGRTCLEGCPHSMRPHRRSPFLTFVVPDAEESDNPMRIRARLPLVTPQVTAP